MSQGARVASRSWKMQGNGFSPGGLQKGSTWTSDLHNCKIVNLFCKTFSLWLLVIAAVGSQHTTIF